MPTSRERRCSGRTQCSRAPWLLRNVISSSYWESSCWRRSILFANTPSERGGNREGERHKRSLPPVVGQWGSLNSATGMPEMTKQMASLVSFPSATQTEVRAV